TVDIFLIALASPIVAATAYLVGLSLLSGRRRAPDSGPPELRFAVVVPAHDEAAGIAATVKSLRALDYPPSLYRIVVVADNCKDDTAERARAAGAEVLVREDPVRRGKGYALAHGFERVLRGSEIDAVVVVDADTVVSPNLLRAFAARLDAGASAIQSDYVVRNPAASWRTLLMTIALATVNTLRSLARERLSVSVGLKGNGMCFTASLLRAVPHDAFSIVEDLEYGIRLGELGHRVHFAGEAQVSGEMPTGEQSSRTQRNRWEEGRTQMIQLHALRLLLEGLRRPSRICLDLALDLLVPPLATLLALTTTGLVASLAISLATGQLLTATWLWLGCALGLCLYALRGFQLSGTGVRGLLALAHVPAYVVWKLALLVRRPAQPSGAWVRTAREKQETL
ncbi:MAG: glycosyltransferase family 2 protein, partial [Minicystis sp.]